MKEFLDDYYVPITISIVMLVFGGVLIVSGYVSEAQRFAAYQKALETVTQCRSSKTGDVNTIFIDNLCGKVPTPADFGIRGNE